MKTILRLFVVVLGCLWFQTSTAQCTTTVNLSTYGGVPGASGATIISAFNQAFNQLKSLGCGTLYIAPGTYDFGNQPSEVYINWVGELSNVVISGYGATLKCTTTASTGMPVILGFRNPNNITISGLTFTDPGTNLNVNWKGAVCIRIDATVACSTFKTIDCVANNVGSFISSQSSARYLFTGADIQATVNTAYYGVNFNYSGRFSKCNLKCSNVRRAFIAYGTRDWDVTVDGTADGVALGSNAYVEMVPDAVSPVENVTVNLTMSGNVKQYRGLVHFYHQSATSTSQYCRNVKANVIFNNVVGFTHMFIFDHETPDAVVQPSTNRTWEQIALTGCVNGTYAGDIISNPSVSTGSTNKIDVASNLAALQNNLSGLPNYFHIIPGSCTPTAPPSPVITKKTTLSIMVDGTLSECDWTNARSVTFTNPSLSDNTVKVSALWDNTNLYLAYEVADALKENPTGTPLYQQDGTELYIDVGHEKSTSTDANDYSYIIAADNSIEYNLAAIGTTITRATTSVANGYITEIAIPWTQLNTSPTSNKLLGILFANNDRDNGASSQFDWKNLISGGSYYNPSLWGDIKLSDSLACNVTTSIQDAGLSGTAFLIYPNPFNTNFTLKFPSSIIIKDAVMKIYEVCGKEVKSFSIINHETTIGSDDLSRGIYFYTIINNNEKITNGKLIVLD